MLDFGGIFSYIYRMNFSEKLSNMKGVSTVRLAGSRLVEEVVDNETISIYSAANRVRLYDYRLGGRDAIRKTFLRQARRLGVSASECYVYELRGEQLLVFNKPVS